ncbi:hypothetical protein P3T76_010332 [Phytophthora citrophthora]|uniref:Uncharacterized protein n=1 Tax=Phytophthora citrophthora TaxID=4793 RepID=A0AAD9GC69_9STRA|nr:hypothetical protein P3T76_010332 [Phytophthora citrophthora]
MLQGWKANTFPYQCCAYIYPQGVLRLAEEEQHPAERRTTCVLDFQDGIGEFQDLFHHLRTAYHEIDVMLTASGLSTAEIPTDDVHIREDVDGKYIEVFANKLLPFSLRETGEVAWDHFKGVEKHFSSGGLYEKAAKVNIDVLCVCLP